MVAVAYKRFQIWWCGCRGVVVATGGSTVTPRIVSLVRQWWDAIRRKQLFICNICKIKLAVIWNFAKQTRGVLGNAKRKQNDEIALRLA